MFMFIKCVLGHTDPRKRLQGTVQLLVYFTEILISYKYVISSVQKTGVTL